MQRGAERRMGFEECPVEEVPMAVAGVGQHQIHLGKVVVVVVGTLGVAMPSDFVLQRKVCCGSVMCMWGGVKTALIKG